ncbi:hypothetical protein [Stenotrophomonas indicatrix]|uniref:hypothetical protein n=1 Tax=Stenotrophomonas indicatrix TaxID=2045451 RepID=UPI0028EB58D8|nr:hypothetical protein [Stenotrophomonas indicatrix]MDT9583403.1 hypothetical protein [Stenotrophomonas indicatrix]
MRQSATLLLFLSLLLPGGLNAQDRSVPDWLQPVVTRIAVLQASDVPAERWQGAELSLALGVQADGQRLTDADALTPVFLDAWQAAPAHRFHRHRLLRLCQGTLACGDPVGRNLGLPTAAPVGAGLLPALLEAQRADDQDNGEGAWQAVQVAWRLEEVGMATQQLRAAAARQPFGDGTRRLLAIQLQALAGVSLSDTPLEEADRSPRQIVEDALLGSLEERTLWDFAGIALCGQAQHSATCRRLATQMTASGDLGLQELALRLVPADPDAQRALDWLQWQQLSARRRGLPAGYLQRAAREGTTAAISRLLQENGLPLTPPAGWSPDTAP